MRLRAATFVALISLSVAVSIGVNAQEHDHSASANEKLGTVHFETSCAPAAQVEFDHAVALLHSFQFGRARDAFHTVLKADPKCAMAYWGLALIDWSNPFAPGAKSATQISDGKRDAELGLAANPVTDAAASSPASSKT